MTTGLIVVGHGVDLTEVARIDRMLEEHGDRFREKVFTETERAYAEAGGRRRGERYAARFAAKEAAFKSSARAGAAASRGPTPRWCTARTAHRSCVCTALSRRSRSSAA